MDTNLSPADHAAGLAPAEVMLFDPGEAMPTPLAASSGAKPRLRYANREQAKVRFCSLDQLIVADHEVRQVWAYVAGHDLSGVLTTIKAVESGAGVAATDPPILFSLRHPERHTTQEVHTMEKARLAIEGSGTVPERLGVGAKPGSSTGHRDVKRKLGKNAKWHFFGIYPFFSLAL